MLAVEPSRNLAPVQKSRRLSKKMEKIIAHATINEMKYAKSAEQLELKEDFEGSDVTMSLSTSEESGVKSATDDGASLSSTSSDEDVPVVPTPTPAPATVVNTLHRPPIIVPRISLSLLPKSIESEENVVECRNTPANLGNDRTSTKRRKSSLFSQTATINTSKSRSVLAHFSTLRPQASTPTPTTERAPSLSASPRTSSPRATSSPSLSPSPRVTSGSPSPSPSPRSPSAPEIIYLPNVSPPTRSRTITPNECFSLSFAKQSAIPDPYDDKLQLFMYEEDGVELVLGGSLHQLLNALTDDRAEPQYADDFLCTYKYFTTGEKLLEHLTKRYLYIAPTESTAEEKAQYNDWRGPIQLRVINWIKKWLDCQFEDFEKNEDLMQSLKSFIKGSVAPQNQKWAYKLTEIINAKFIYTINAGGVVTPKIGLQSIDVLAALLKNSDLVRNRTWRLTKYKQCFVGQEAVDWMMKNMGLASRQLAVDLGSKLVFNQLIVCVSKEKNTFRDTPHSFYQFTKLTRPRSPCMDINSPRGVPTRNPLTPRQSASNNGSNNGNTSEPENMVHADGNNAGSDVRDTLPPSSMMIYRNESDETLPEFPLAIPILPRKGILLHVLTINPKEMARQLTSIEFDMYKSIPISELSHQRWSKNGGVDTPHVTTMINRFNSVGFWVATEIVSTYSLPNRIAILKRFVKIAHVCKKLNNFNTMMEIAVGLNMGAITRLTKMWQALDPKTQFRYDGIMALTQSCLNYKAYREVLKTAEFPVLPYLALHLRDLTFTEDGNKDTLQDGSINFYKMRRLSNIFGPIKQYQQNGYKFTTVPEIQNFVLNEVKIETNSDALYKLSYVCECSKTLSISKPPA